MDAARRSTGGGFLFGNMPGRPGEIVSF